MNQSVNTTSTEQILCFLQTVLGEKHLQIYQTPLNQQKMHLCILL